MRIISCLSVCDDAILYMTRERIERKSLASEWMEKIKSFRIFRTNSTLSCFLWLQHAWYEYIEDEDTPNVCDGGMFGLKFYDAEL